MVYSVNKLLLPVIFSLPFVFLTIESRRNIDEPVFFKCNDGKNLKYEDFCDGYADCANGEDENTNTTNKSIRCINPDNDHNASCSVSRDDICTSKVMCSNVSPCDLHCESHYRCNNGSCLLRSTVCDWDPCYGCEEDHGWSNGVGFKCARNGTTCVLPQQLLYDNISDCLNGADLCFQNASNDPRATTGDIDHEKCFRCLSGDMIISAGSVCDGVIDCSDMSDECACDMEVPDICRQVVSKETHIEPVNEMVDARENGTKRNCDVGDVRCSNGKCITKVSVCDGKVDCEGTGEDEEYGICRGTIACKDAQKVEACRCSVDREQLHCRATYATACDGLAQCPVPQRHGWIIHTLNTFPEDECGNAKCLQHPSTFTCEKVVPKERREWLYGAWCEKPHDITVNGEYTQSIEGWKYCDGVVDCELSGSDEQECDNRFACNSTKLGHVNIPNDHVCDGIIDCVDGKDEDVSMCGGQNELDRFPCPAFDGKMVSIGMSFRCNYVINCDDASDEIGCDDDRFYCEDGEAPIFVRRNQPISEILTNVGASTFFCDNATKADVCSASALIKEQNYVDVGSVKDGRGDCADWSDECPTRDGSTAQDAFSSRYELIENTGLRIMVWIMGIMSLAGNAVVIVHESRSLRRPKRKLNHATRANRVLILNLAGSDFLMGVYLLCLGTIAVRMKGDYCSQANEWRTSSFCVSLGVISVISSETSVMTMVILTALRLYAVVRPFQSSSRPSFRVLIALVCLTWVSSLTLALLPLTSNLAHIFVAGADFIFNPFVKRQEISLNNAKEVFSNMVTYYQWNTTKDGDLNTFMETASWQSLQDKSNSFGIRYFDPKTLWGYYSAASVCIPKFFITTEDPAWVFSLVVNLFNMIAFTFVAISYVLIYVYSRKNASLVRRGDDDRKQMKAIQTKILRLVATDFFCWVPICIMAFVKLAGYHVSSEAYAFAAIILLPLNSALNPLMYSDFVDSLLRRTVNFFRSWTSSFESGCTASSRAPEPNIPLSPMDTSEPINGASRDTAVEHTKSSHISPLTGNESVKETSN